MPAVLLRSLAALRSVEQLPVASAGVVIAENILFRRLLALAAQLRQACMNCREIIGSAGSGHVSSWDFAGCR